MTNARNLLLLLLLRSFRLASGSPTANTTLSVTGEPPRHLRRSNDNDSTYHLFRITLAGQWVENDRNDLVSQESVVCIPIIKRKETDDLYSIDLPPDIVDSNYDKLAKGDLFVRITQVAVENDTVILQKNSMIVVIEDPRIQTRSSNPTEGRRSIAIVRISTRDSSPQDSARALRSMLDDDTVNLKTQFSFCSHGAIEWELAPAGVVDVFVDRPVSDFKTGAALVSAAQKTMTKSMNIKSPADLGDKVLMCLPPGTGKWVASSGVNHWRAQFNDGWCRSLTATMHELGHTLGLNHANEKGVAYGDATGYMSAGHRQIDWPRKCFNGLKNWELGWFKRRQHTLVSDFGTGHLVKLATFIDFDKTDYDEPVILNIANKFYLQYNVAKEYNVDTEEKKNKVTITAPSKSGSESVGAVKVGEKHYVPNFRGNGKTLVIEACKKKRGSLGAEIMFISVALEKSLCKTFFQEELSYVIAKLHISKVSKGNFRDPAPDPTPGAPAKVSKQTSGHPGFWELVHQIASKRTAAKSSTSAPLDSDRYSQHEQDQVSTGKDQSKSRDIFDRSAHQEP